MYIHIFTRRILHRSAVFLYIRLRKRYVKYASIARRKGNYAFYRAPIISHAEHHLREVKVDTINDKEPT